MNKRNIISNFFIGGCVGKTLMEFSGIIANLFMRNNLKDMFSQVKSLIIIFIIGGIGFNLAKLSINKIEKKDMKSKYRQKLLKKQMYITSGAIMLFSVFVIIYILNNNYVGAILALSFDAVFSFWGYAFLLSYINLRNNMAMINKTGDFEQLRSKEIDENDE